MHNFYNHFLLKTNNLHNTLETLESHFEFHIKIDLYSSYMFRSPYGIILREYALYREWSYQNKLFV